MKDNKFYTMQMDEVPEIENDPQAHLRSRESEYGHACGARKETTAADTVLGSGRATDRI